MTYQQMLATYAELQEGDVVELDHEVKVGFRSWPTTTRGTVVRKERRRHSLHYDRNFDDKVFSDIIVLRREDGELTTVTLDEFSQLRKLESPTPPSVSSSDQGESQVDAADTRDNRADSV